MTSETLQVLEDCGAAEMPPEEVCVIAEIDEATFWGEEAQKAYRKGQLRSKLSIRQAVIKMAKAGNPQMVKIYQDFTAENATHIPPTVKLEPEGEGEFDWI